MTPTLRQYLALAVGAILLTLGGYAFGRFQAPDRVKESTKQTVTVVQDTQSQERIRRLTEELESLKRDTHRVETVVTRKDGTSERTVTTDTHVDRERSDHTKLDHVATSETHTKQTVDLTSVKVSERDRPSVSVGVVGVADLRGNFWVGAEAGRRLFGPVWLTGGVLVKPSVTALTVKSDVLFMLGVHLEF